MNGLLVVIFTIGLWTPSPPLVSVQPMSRADDTTADELDPRFIAPPEPDRTGPNWVIAAGGILIAAGVVGMLSAQGCVTWDDKGRCQDPYGGHSLYPSLVVLGFGTAISGAYWSRHMSSPTRPERP